MGLGSSTSPSGVGIRIGDRGRRLGTRRPPDQDERCDQTDDLRLHGLALGSGLRDEATRKPMSATRRVESSAARDALREAAGG